jgi:hypothetical protein
VLLLKEMTTPDRRENKICLTIRPLCPSEADDGRIEMTVGHALTNLSKNFVNEREKSHVEGRLGDGDVPGRALHGLPLCWEGELCDGDAGKDADEQLAAQSFLIPFLLRMGYASCGLWLIF